jgi:hypothetical protein
VEVVAAVFTAVGMTPTAKALMTMTEMIYDEQGDSAAVLTNGEIGPDDTADVRELDADRIVRYDAVGRAIEYQFFNVRRHGVRLNDLENSDDRVALARLFREAGFQERTWGTPVRYTDVRRRRDIATG